MKLTLALEGRSPEEGCLRVLLHHTQARLVWIGEVRVTKGLRPRLDVVCGEPGRHRRVSSCGGARRRVGTVVEGWKVPLGQMKNANLVRKPHSTTRRE